MWDDTTDFLCHESLPMTGTINDANIAPLCPVLSDLALRNCLLTSELAVKIGDYGLSHSKYKVSLCRLLGLQSCWSNFFWHCLSICSYSISMHPFPLLGWLLCNSRSNMGSSTLDCPRTYWRSPRQSLSRGPNQGQQCLVRNNLKKITMTEVLNLEVTWDYMICALKCNLNAKVNSA